MSTPTTPSLPTAAPSIPTAASMPGAVVGQFPPIYNNLPAITARDPFGLLPYRRRVQTTKNLVVEWDSKNKPVRDGQRVPPSELRDYRVTHEFRYPNCLCSVHELDPNHVTESAVFMVNSGRLGGQYVAACALGICKYWVFIERMYPKRSQPVHVYPLRGSSSPAPGEVVYEGDDDAFAASTPSVASVSSSASSSRPLRRKREDSIKVEDVTPIRPFKRRIFGSDAGSSSSVTMAAGSSSPINPFIVPYATPEPLPKLSSPFSMLMQLDASNNAGLTESQFRQLFVRCSSCKLFTTASAFEDHSCRISSDTSAEIIDLTGDD
ncbi:hypothetical protein C8J57DRAFT_1234771 [Mycena rebaudengoi]|nr:hypothetical protein C8J57DRAFT_1234771 [Mycena rebaudengoi]